ncbi:MAG: ROK family protein, partial [Rhodospirillaceae bacterium]|nr:ROK family protein [Rhodospirillaceae bacterium]
LAGFPSDGATLDDTASGLAILRRLDDLGLSKSAGPADDGQRLRDIAEPGESLPVAARTVLADSGAELGKALRLLATVLKPQAVLLAGQVGRHPDYVAGVRRAASDPALAGRPFETEVSALTTAQSAVWLALDRHLFHERFDLGRLAPERAGGSALAAA